jgi:hypothetical protein
MDSWAVMGRQKKRLPVGKPTLVSKGNSANTTEEEERNKIL